MKIKIRRATLKDAYSIYHLILSATQRGKILKRPLKEIQKSIHHFWVAEDEKKIVACCAIEVYNKKLAEVRSLVVHPGEEKKGLATSLVKKSIEEAKRKQIYEVLVITNRENIFKRLGFSEQLHDQKALFLRP